MWYAASEIIFFLVLAAAIGASVGYGIAQIYQLDFGGMKDAVAARKSAGADLAEARVEIADLRRKLDLVTEALRGEAAHAFDLVPPPFAPSTAADVVTDETVFPPVPATDLHPAEPVETATEGRRLSERVADAERG
jgi:hypothetical protein